MLGGIPCAVGLYVSHVIRLLSKLFFLEIPQIASFSYKKGMYLLSNVGRNDATIFLPHETIFINSLKIWKTYICKDWIRT